MMTVPQHLRTHNVCDPRAHDYTIDLNSKLGDILKNEAAIEDRPARYVLADIRGSAGALPTFNSELPLGTKFDYVFRFRYFPFPKAKMILDLYNRVHKMKFRFAVNVIRDQSTFPNVLQMRTKDIIGLMADKRFYQGSYTTSFPEMENVYAHTRVIMPLPPVAAEPRPVTLDSFSDDQLLDELVKRAQNRMPDWHERLYPREKDAPSRKIA